MFLKLYILNYLNPIEACQTKANNKKKTGIIGKTSTIGLKTMYASGKRDNNKVSIIIKFIYIYKTWNDKNLRFNIINFTLKIINFMIYINVLLL